MLNDMLDVRRWEEPGYRSLLFSDGWRAAVLNDVSRFYRENINELQRHNTSDELFVLLKGSCTLLIGTQGEDGRMTLDQVPLRPCTFYTVRRGVWHSHILEQGTSVAVIENADVGPENTDLMPIDIHKVTLRTAEEGT